MNIKRITALILSFALVIFTLSACSQTNQNTNEEEMTRDDVPLDGEVIEVMPNDESAYSVIITEDHLMEDPMFAEEISEVTTIAEVEAAEKTDDLPDVISTSKAAPGWDLSQVKQEDVSISYICPVIKGEGDDTQVEDEVHFAEVTAFENNGGEISLSFKGEQAEGDFDTSYTVRFAGTDSYAVINPIAEDNGIVIESVDFEAQIKELEAYDPDFEEKDLSLPEGTYIEDGTLVVTDEADDVVSDVLVGTGVAEEEMDRADPADANAQPVTDSDTAAIQYMKQVNGRQMQFRNYDAVASYTPEILGYINPTAGKVSGLGADTYRIFKGFYLNDWGSGIQGSMGVLKMFGLFKTPQGVSNEQVLSAVQQVGIEVSQVHELTKVMNGTLNETLRQAYRNNLQTFDNAVLSLQSNSEIVQNMLVEGAIRAAEDGIEPPDENCSAEEEYEYNYELIEYIEGLEKAGGRKNSAFKGFSDYVKAMESDFMLVAGEVAKSEDTNPVKSYDKYWNLHFNFDTQGYYLRQAYRSKIEYELKRAFSLIEIYNNVFDPYSKGIYMEYNNKLFKALDQLEALGPGKDPENVIAADGHSWQFATRVHCNTFNKDIVGINITYRCEGNNVPVDLLEEYINRLHGRTPYDDLKLAGMAADTVQYNWWNDYKPGLFQGNTWSCYAHGIGFNGKYTKEYIWKADMIQYEPLKLVKNCYLYNNGKKFAVDDSDGTQSMRLVVWFMFG
jgi:hypothetical protein